jgi:type I restriction enzyme, S subunit
MREMKDSGIEWIGKIPVNWNKQKIKYTLTQRVKKNNPVICKSILSLTAKQGVVPYSEKEGAGGNKPKEDYSSYNLAYPNDIVMNSMNVISGSVGLSKYFGCVSPVYYMFYSDTNDIRFFNYIFQTSVFQRSLLGLGNGILMKESDNGKFNTVRMRIPMDKLGLEFLPVCSLSEQQKIADFLDQKCSEIDALTADIKTQIETLEEYKKSVITEAVTKGLDPNVEMKDSGVEWIGKIPKEWNIKKIKYLSYESSQKKLMSNEDAYLGLENVRSYSEKLIETDSLYDDGIQKFCKKGNVLFAKLRPYLAKVIICPFDTFSTGEFLELSTISTVLEPRFLKYSMLNTSFLNSVNLSTYGAKMPRADASYIVNMKICVPDLSQQRKIADFLDEKSSEIDLTISEKQQQLETLAEYKKSLIYEYVTGKKEVA